MFESRSLEVADGPDWIDQKVRIRRGLRKVDWVRMRFRMLRQPADPRLLRLEAFYAVASDAPGPVNRWVADNAGVMLTARGVFERKERAHTLHKRPSICT